METLLPDLGSERFVKGHTEQGDAIPASAHEKDEHQDKVSIIGVANALIDPETVVVKL
jgi:uncharacterized protein YjgD (DUF1641 family)